MKRKKIVLKNVAPEVKQHKIDRMTKQGQVIDVDVDAEVVIRHLKNLGMVNLFPLKVMLTYAMKDMDS